MQLNKNKAGLALGVLVSAIHFLWLLLVITNLGQWYLDFIFNLHQLNNPYTVMPFNLGTGILLLLITFVVGYIMGWIFAWVWNYLHKNRA